MKNRAKMGVQMAASVLCPAAVPEQIVAHGQWKAWAFAPIELIDPIKFLDLVAGEMRQRVEVLQGGLVHLSSFERMVRYARVKFPHLARDIERLASGGRQFWSDDWSNMIVNAGLNDMLDKYFKGSAYTAAHYVGLTDGTPTVAAGDTMGSHAGWAEVTAYTETVRQTLTLGTVSSQSVDNSASKATYSINADSTTIGGAFVAGSSAKSETASTLLSVGAFSGGDLVLNNGSTLTVQGTYSLADA